MMRVSKFKIVGNMTLSRPSSGVLFPAHFDLILHFTLPPLVVYMHAKFVVFSSGYTERVPKLKSRSVIHS